MKKKNFPFCVNFWIDIKQIQKVYSSNNTANFMQKNNNHIISLNISRIKYTTSGSKITQQNVRNSSSITKQNYFSLVNINFLTHSRKREVVRFVDNHFIGLSFCRHHLVEMYASSIYHFVDRYALSTYHYYFVSSLNNFRRV